MQQAAIERGLRQPGSTREGTNIIVKAALGAAELGKSEAAVVEAPGILGHEHDTGREGDDRIFVVPELIGTLPLVEVGPETLRLQVQGPLQFLGSVPEVTGLEQGSAQGVMFPGGARDQLSRPARRRSGLVR